MAAYAGDSEPAVEDRTLQRGAHRVVTVPLEQRIELLDVTASELAVPVRDLRQHDERIAPEVEHLLPLLVELCSLAVDGGNFRGSVLRQRRGWLAFQASAMAGLVAAGDDAKSILVEEECAGDVGGLRRHRVGRALEEDLRGRPHEDRKPEGELFRNHLDRAQARQLLLT